MTDLLGQTFGNYRIEALIGSGGMAQVYRGIHVHLDRAVAIKVMLPHIAADPGFQARFLQEGKVIASLNHPNIVQVYDSGQQDGQFYLVMELITGGSMRTLLQQRATAGSGWSQRIGLDLVIQAAGGLDYAHRRGMVHRDVKPDNLLLQALGADATPDHAYTVKISDFGLARLAEGGVMTATGLTMGTPAYMAPEQCQGVELDGRSDLYSLGVVLYEILTGKPPFAARTLTEAVYQHVYTQPPAPRTVRPDLSPELEAITLRCLAKKPAERFATGADLARALQATTIEAGATIAGPAQSTAARLPDIPLPSATVARLTPLDVAAPAAPSVLGATGLPRVQVVDAQGQSPPPADLGSAGLTIGRLPDNDVTLDDDAVSRYHARLDWDGRAVTVTDLGSRNGTLLGEARLLPRVASPWDGQDWLRIGPYWLRLTLPAAPRRPDAVQRPATPGPAQADGAGRIRVVLEQETLAITPGQPAAIKATLANVGSTVDHLTLTVDGVPAAWVAGPAEAVQLNPHAQSVVALTVNAPRAPGSYAGEYPVTLRATSRQTPADSGAASALWTVLPFSMPGLALAPARAGGRTRAAYTLTVANGGNAPARYSVRAADDEQLLRYAFGQDTITLDPFSEVAVPLSVRAPWRWIGRPVDRRFSVQATGTGAAPAPASGEFVHQALLPPWVTAVPVVILAILLLLKALLTPTITDFHAEPQNPVAGQPVVVSWSVQKANHVELQPMRITATDATTGGHVFDQGLDGPTTLTLIASNVFGTATKQLSINAAAPTPTPSSVPPTPTITPTPTVAPTPTPTPVPGDPIIDQFDVQPLTAQAGTTVTITWKVRDADKVEIEHVGTVPTSGSVQVPVQQSTSFTLTATHQGKTVDRVKNVIVNTPTPVPTATPRPTAVPTPTPVPTPPPPPTVRTPTGNPPPPTAAPDLRGIVAGSDGLWITSAGANVVVHVPWQGSQTSIPVGRTPSSIAIDPSGVWVADTGDGTVQRIDPKTNQVVATIHVGKEPSSVGVGVDAGGKEMVWVANRADGTVQRIDPQTNQATGTPILVGKEPSSVAVSKDAVWVASAGDGVVRRIDPKTNQVVGAAIPVGKGPVGIALGGDAVWVATAGDNAVWRISVQNGQATGAPKRIAVGNGPSSLTVDAGSVWVACATDSTVWRINAQTGDVIGKPIPVDPNPSSVSAGKDASGKDTIFVLSRTTGNVTPIAP